MKNKISESDLQEILENICEYELESAISDAEEVYQVEKSHHSIRTKSFKEANLLTRDSGFVLCIDGQEFQITIVKSK